ncbi:hypothetical protein Tco_1346197 [Tanacetum coccineum]
MDMRTPMKETFPLFSGKFPRRFPLFPGVSAFPDVSEMDLLAFIHVADPTKVKVGERERAEEEPKLLDSTVGRVVPLLPIAPDHAERELEASVERLFDEGGCTEQGDSAVGGGQETESEKRQAASDASGSSHPHKKLRSDHGTSSGAVSAGKSPSALKELLASSILNVEFGVKVVATLPFVTSFISATPEHESGVPADFITRPNVRTIGASERFVISSDSSHHSSTNASRAKGDSVIRSAVVPPVMTEAVIATHVTSIPSALAPESSTKVVTPVHASMFHDFDSTGTVRPDAAGSSHVPRKELLMGSREVDYESLQDVFVPRWNIPNDSLLDNLDASREFIDHLDPSVLFAQIRDMDYDELFTEFSVGIARQACLSAKVRMRTEYWLRERRRLESECERQAGLLKAIDDEVEGLKAQLLLREAEAVEAIRLRAEVSKFKYAEKSLRDETDALKERNAILEKERNALDVKVADLEALAVGKEHELTDLNCHITSVKSQNDVLVDRVHELEVSSSGLLEKVTVYENCMEQLERFQDDRMKVVNYKFDQLHTDFVELALHLEEKFYPHLLTTISCRRCLLTQGIELAIVKCLKSPEYLSVLGAAISKAIEKGMQDGLFAGITYGKEGRVLTDVAAHNPFAEADYVFALQKLQNVNFSLLAELKSNKDASAETVMDLLHLEEPLAERLGLTELQPTVDYIRVWKIRKNIANQRSALRSVFVSLAEPFSPAALTVTKGTSSIVSAAANTTTSLSTTLASASTIPPITIEDYDFIDTDGPEVAQGSGQGEVASFPHTIEFEREELV